MRTEAMRMRGICVRQPKKTVPAIVHCCRFSPFILLLAIVAVTAGVSLTLAQAQPDLVVSSPSPAAKGGPHIVFPELTYDFGTVEQGEEVVHLFRFTNQGNQDLRIDGIKTSCGCTAAVVSSDILPPGQEGTISATFDTVHFAGEKVKTLTVYSNDPHQPVATLTLQGDVVVEVTAEPAQLYLGRIRRGEEVVQTIEVLYDASKSIVVTKVENANPAIHIRTEEIEKDASKGQKLTVTLDKTAALGRLNDEITVTTTSEKIPVLHIPVFGSIEGDMLVQPPQVSFGVINSGEGKTQEVLIKSRATTPVHVLRVESSLAEVTPEISEIKQGEEYRLTVKAKTSGKPGRLQGEIQVFTDHPEEKVLTIPLYGMIGGV